MIQQLRRFLGVCLLATLAHAVTALFVSAALSTSTQLANLAGFAVAASISYFGHACVTFEKPGVHAARMLRFLALALAGLAQSSAITALVCSGMGESLAAAQLVVVTTVPLISFLGSKYWVFSQ